MRLALALLVAIAIGACTRIVVLSVPPDASRIPDGALPDAHILDGHDGGLLPDAAFGDAGLD